LQTDAIWINFDALRGRQSFPELRSAPRCLDSICWVTRCATRSIRDSTIGLGRKERRDHDAHVVAGAGSHIDRLRLSEERRPAAEDRGVPWHSGQARADQARGEGGRARARSPRFAFDQAAGMLYIADVGQDKYEEINVMPLSAAGVNYGWNTMEGPSCYKPPVCMKGGLQQPAYSYPHEGGTCSIIGGLVYRGRKIPENSGAVLLF
jgi:hypothetical protein